MKQMLKHFPLDKKKNDTKNILFFLSQFYFYLKLFYELKQKIHPSESVCGIFCFRFVFLFIKFYIFVQQNA